MLKYLSIILLLFFFACKTNPPNYPATAPIELESDSLVAVKYTSQPISVNKLVLLEDFANVSCDPCAKTNKILESIKKYTYGTDKLVMIKYPINWPAPNDLFYHANKSDCDKRISFYKILIAPTTTIDGTLRPVSSDSNDIKQKIAQQVQLKSNIKINVTDSIAGDYYFVKYSIETNDTTLLSNYSLNIVTTETDIKFTTPPGSNGETDFHDVMRIFLPKADNQKFVYSNQTGYQTNVIKMKINPLWNGKIKAIAFLQNKITKEVLQTGSTF